jgi:hypothetical protein
LLLLFFPVGSGAGKVLKSVGQGVGQTFGGGKVFLDMFDFILCMYFLTILLFVVAGGVLLVGKGFGKGITQGDGRAVASGLMQGGAAVGNGVGQGKSRPQNSTSFIHVNKANTSWLR